MIDLDFTYRKPEKCKHCGRVKGKHKAYTLNCPFGSSRNFPNFSEEQFFELKKRSEDLDDWF